MVLQKPEMHINVHIARKIFRLRRIAHECLNPEVYKVVLAAEIETMHGPVVGIQPHIPFHQLCTLILGLHTYLATVFVVYHRPAVKYIFIMYLRLAVKRRHHLIPHQRR